MPGTEIFVRWPLALGVRLPAKMVNFCLNCICMSVLCSCSVIQLEICNGDTAISSLIIQDCFSYPEYFVFSHEDEDSFSNFCKRERDRETERERILMEIALDL